MTHTDTHLDLDGLTAAQRDTLAALADQWANSDDTAPNIRAGAARLALEDIDAPDVDAKDSLAEDLYATGDPRLAELGLWLEWASIRARCAKDHDDWRGAPDWCVCDGNTPTTTTREVSA